MLPKLKGDSRAELVALLLAQGAEQHALALVGSRSAVRRCRGAFQLGMLGLDRPRRPAGGAAATTGTSWYAGWRCGRWATWATPAPYDRCCVLGEHDTRLTRDLVFALDRLGPGAADELRTRAAPRRCAPASTSTSTRRPSCSG